MTKNYHDLEVKPLSLTIGPYKLRALSTTQFGLDGGAMFGTVPKVLWERTNPSDDKNRILMDCRCLLLESEDRKILIDTGLGGDFLEKYGPKLGAGFAKMYGVKSGEASGIVAALKKLNLSTQDITDVILTHLHFDHAGGATKYDNDKIVPTFEKAQYYIQKKNYEVALNPNLREKASYYHCNYVPLKEHGVLTLLDGETEILPHIKNFITHGHTEGQQGIWIDTDKSEDSLFYCADLIPTATHVRLPWIMGYDLNPLQIIEEKNQLLHRVTQKNTYLFFEHDPYCSTALVEEISKGGRMDYRLKELFNLQ